MVLPSTFRLSDDTPRSVRQILLSRGCVEFNPSLPSTCHLHWTTKQCLAPPPPSSSSSSLCLFNHFPSTSSITQKDCLARSMRRCRAVYGPIYDFIPHTFILPREAQQWKEEAARILPPSPPHEECKEQVSFSSHSSPTPLWIVKPSLSSQGRGISLTRFPHPVTEPSVVQRYLSDPHLLFGYKYDIRVYVLVTSIRPLRAFLCTEGLCRFSSSPFDPSSSSLYSHITNSSIAKHSPHLSSLPSSLPSSCKWTLAQYEEQSGLPPLLPSLIPLVLLTLLPLIPSPSPSSSFELFGFDFLRDSVGRLYLVEVNKSPSLTVKGVEDKQVKYQMIDHLMDIIGMGQPEHREKGDMSEGGVGCWQAIWPTSKAQEDLNERVSEGRMKGEKQSAAMLSAYMQSIVNAAKQQTKKLKSLPNLKRRTI